MKRTVLLVDDDELFTDVLKMCLPDSDKSWHILTAPNGLAALEILDKTSVDLVVTDLAMPVMNGIEFLAELSVTGKRVPVIIMTSTPVASLKLPPDSALGILQKPVSVERLQAELSRHFDSIATSSTQTIPLTSFLQLLHQERKQVTVRLECKDETGFLHILDGQLFDAETASLTGLPAAYALLSWSDARIKMLPLVPNRPITIDQKIEFVIMESARLQDEARARGDSPETDFSHVSFGSSILMATGKQPDVVPRRQVEVKPTVSAVAPSPSSAPPATQSPPVPKPPNVAQQTAMLTPRGTSVKYPALVNALSHSSIKAVHATARPSGETAHSHDMPKASVERAQYMAHLASLMGKELGLMRVFEVRCVGKNTALWFKEGSRFSVAAETSATADLDGLAETLAGEV
jgi:CheY-like chemotaxis protein